MTGKYLSFNEEMSIRLSPFGCEVLRDNSLVMSGNPDMGTFLRSCDGKATLEEVLKKKTDSIEHYEEALAHVGPLVDALVRKNILRVFEEPRPVVVNVATQSGLAPSVVALELTDRCNLRCAYCYQECSPSGNIFMREPLSILAFLKKISVRGVELTGGEPTMHPQFMDILEYVCNNFSLTGLITNGTLLSDEMMDVMKRGSAMPSVQICLDGPSKETVDTTDGMPGAFEKIIRGIRLVKRHGIILRVGMVMDSEAKVDLIEDTLLVAKELGADCFIATPAINFGRAANRNLLDPEFMGKFMPIHELMKEKYGKFYASEAEAYDPRISNGCGAGQRDITVNPNGMVKICSIQPSAWFNFGHVTDIETPAVQELFHSFSKLPSPSVDSCKGCDHMAYCMNCYIRAFNLLTTRAIEPDRCKWYQQNADLLRRFDIQ